MKLLDVMRNSTLSANLHLNYVIGIINQRLYFLNQLCRQGLDFNGLAKVLLRIVVACFLYALPVFSEMITAEDINRINAAICKAKKIGVNLDDTQVPETHLASGRRLWDGQLFGGWLDRRRTSGLGKETGP